jgi:hypothetical protein
MSDYDVPSAGDGYINTREKVRPIGQNAGYNTPTSLIKTGDIDISNF